MNTQLQAHRENEETGLYRTYKAMILGLAAKMEGGFTAEEMTKAVRKQKNDFTIAVSTVHPRIIELAQEGKIAANGETRTSSKHKQQVVYILHESEPDPYTEVISRVVIKAKKDNPEHCVAEVDGKRTPPFLSKRAAYTFVAALYGGGSDVGSD